MRIFVGGVFACEVGNDVFRNYVKAYHKLYPLCKITLQIGDNKINRVLFTDVNGDEPLPRPKEIKSHLKYGIQKLEIVSANHNPEIHGKEHNEFSGLGSYTKDINIPSNAGSVE